MLELFSGGTSIKPTISLKTADLRVSILQQRKRLRKRLGMFFYDQTVNLLNTEVWLETFPLRVQSITSDIQQDALHPIRELVREYGK